MFKRFRSNLRFEMPRWLAFIITTIIMLLAIGVVYVIVNIAILYPEVFVTLFLFTWLIVVTFLISKMVKDIYDDACRARNGGRGRYDE
jgi:hypothetical protein